MTSIAIIVPYFGHWPQWRDLFFESCRRNRSIDFFIYSDQDLPALAASSSNIHFEKITFQSYCNKASDTLCVNFHPQRAYKLCDLKPFLGIVHHEELEGYDFWGFGDCDLVWGDLRQFYTETLLQSHDVLSTHADRLSGHLTLIRNRDDLVHSAELIPHWKTLLADTDNHTMDEQNFTLQFYPQARWLWKIHRHLFFRFKFNDEWASYNHFCKFINRLILPQRLYFNEWYTSPWFTETEAANLQVVAQHKWLYHNGKITSLATGAEIPYLHFLSLKRHWTTEQATCTPPYDNLVISLDGFSAATPGSKQI